jgi:hypothetical protein
MQRLAEDRQKRVMEEWQTEREKEWERFKLDTDERWRENARVSDKREARMSGVEEFLRQLSPQIDALWEIPEAWSQFLVSVPGEWMATWDEMASQRPPMPEPLKSPPVAPSQMPKIRPLPSTQDTTEQEEE